MSDRSEAPTQRELDLLKVLWRLGEGSVRQVYEEVGRELGIVQNTVQALLRTMEEKGLVAHRVEGRTFLYRPTRDRQTTERTLLQSLLDRAFDGAVAPLVAHALDVGKPRPAELRELRVLLEAAEKRERERAREEKKR